MSSLINNQQNPYQDGSVFVTMPPKRTVSGLLWSKFLDNIETATLPGVMRFTGGVCATAVLTYAMNYTDQFADISMMVLRAGDWLVLKATSSAVIVFFHRDIFRVLQQSCLVGKQDSNISTIDGIPVPELLDHLFTFGTFKRADIEGKFGIPRNRFDALGKKLDDLGVTYHGTNNARLLNQEYSRQDIAAILEGKTTAKELEGTQLKQIDKNTWTSDPTASIIQKRVEDATLSKIETTSKPPIFTMRPLSA